MTLPTTLAIATLLALLSAPCFAQGATGGAAVSAAQGVDAGERSKPRQVKPPVETGKKQTAPEQVPHAPIQPK